MATQLRQEENCIYEQQMGNIKNGGLENIKSQQNKPKHAKYIPQHDIALIPILLFSI